MRWYLEVLKKYADFHGRARRTEFWMYFLFSNIIITVLAILAANTDYVGGLLSAIYALLTLLPSIAVTARRLHDTGRSLWNFLWIAVPLGGLAFLLLMAEDSVPGANEYGPNPKGR